MLTHLLAMTVWWITKETSLRLFCHEFATQNKRSEVFLENSRNDEVWWIASLWLKPLPRNDEILDCHTLLKKAKLAMRNKGVQSAFYFHDF